MRYVKEYGVNCLYLYDKDVNRHRVINNYGLDKRNTYSYAKMFRDDKDVFIDYLKTNKIEVVLFDESHIVGAKTIDMKWVDVIEACYRNGIKVIGGTATEIRSSGVDVTKEYFHGIEVFKYDIEDAVKKLNRTKRYIAIFVRGNGIEKYHELMQSNIEINDNERIITKAVDSLNINGDVYNSFSSLAIFLNVPLSTLADAINRDKLKNLLEVNRYDERILFKENSPYSTWFADDTWIYKCPVCKRKLLMSTEELINYKHDDVLCIELEIE